MGVPKPIEERVIAIPEKIKSSNENLKVISVCNPGATLFSDDKGEKIYLLLRVMEKTNDEFPGHIAAPRAIKNSRGEYEIRWEWERANKDANCDDKVLMIVEPEERKRPTYISHFRLAESKDGINFKISEKPTFFPREKYEEFGIEDARITKLEDGVNIGGKNYKHLISYVACSGEQDVCTAFSVTNDFKNFVRLPKKNPAPIFFSPSKDVVVFPKKIKNPRTGEYEFAALTRPYGQAGYMVPSIVLSRSKDLIQWGDHQLFIKGDEKGHVGAGPAPLECEDGFLIIDHQHRHHQDGTKEYIGRAYLVDKRDPSKILKRSDEILEPHLKIENAPFVNNVTFPSGAIIKGDNLFIYTGENDVATAVYVYKFKDFMDFLSPV
ncbi:MAG: hypothetical protein PHH54_05260 [Candidatus Nanoarchaeia archaeon]|nr:hypothetical protein [Candidatus Nanoarchaeia archaeon]MDD5741366.1 hypothetical protein [Candidatus Nanoarchaeia archaeon]